MKNKIINMLLLFASIAFVLSGCGEKGKADKNKLVVVPDKTEDSVTFDTVSDETKSELNDSSNTASEKKGSEKKDNKKPDNKNPDNKKPDNNSSAINPNEQEKPEEPVIYPKPTVGGGTVIGTTSKGFTIKEKNGVTYIDGILVVNKTYSLPESYAPGLNSLCNKAFKQMKNAAKNDGISIWISSSYRSYKSQKKLYEAYCERDGSAAADRYSARPGHSEHQSGYAIDVNSASTVAYQSTYKKVGEWLKENCWKFGFVIRYPRGKEGITGYQHEPWHIRYVGTELAQLLTEGNMTIEEYLGINSSYTTAPPIEDEPDDDEENNSSTPNDTPSLIPDKDNSSEENSDNNNSDSGKTENEDNSTNQENNIETSCTTEQT